MDVTDNGHVEPDYRERVLLVPKQLNDLVASLYARALDVIPAQTAKTEHDFLLAMLLNGCRIMDVALTQEEKAKNLIVAPDAPLPKDAGDFMNRVSNQWKPLDGA